MREFGIGDLAKRSGVPVATFRYYEEIAILPKPARRTGGQRSYDERVMRRLMFVKNCRELGFNLEQVKTLLHLSEPKNLTCTEAKELSVVQLATVRKRIGELQAIEKELAKHLATCDSLCGCGRVPECPVLDVSSLSGSVSPPLQPA